MLACCGCAIEKVSSVCCSCKEVVLLGSRYGVGIRQRDGVVVHVQGLLARQHEALCSATATHTHTQTRTRTPQNGNIALNQLFAQGPTDYSLAVTQSLYIVSLLASWRKRAFVAYTNPELLSGLLPTRVHLFRFDKMEMLLKHLFAKHIGFVRHEVLQH